MIAKTYILKDLKAIDSLYKKARTPKQSLFYSKLAIIELCGWIEMTMDEIVLRCAKRHIKETGNYNWLEKELVGRIYGFDYKSHFRKMLLGILGMSCVEIVEARVDQTKFLKMKSELAALKGIRDPAAHTHLKGATTSLDAPSVTLNRFNQIYEGLIEIDAQLREYKPKRSF